MGSMKENQINAYSNIQYTQFCLYLKEQVLIPFQ
jgi:hypothetical protein